MRKCFNCGEHLPPETEHFVYDNEFYCTGCIEAKPYTAYFYELHGDFIGTSEDGDIVHVEDHDDFYEEN